MTSQVLLIRNGKVPLHRKPGTIGAVLAVAVVIAGLWAALTPAALNRAIGNPLLHPLLASGVWQTYVQIFAATDLLVLGIGIYDLWTRRRIDPAWTIGALWILAGQWTASWLYFDPSWKAIATSMLQMWVS